MRDGVWSVGKKVKTVIVILLLIIFVFSVSRLLSYYLEYRKVDELYEGATAAYVAAAPGQAGEAAKTADGEESSEKIICPIEVDFEGLLAVNEEVVGWLYCEDTNINYPVMHGTDNDYYLHHSYDGTDSRAGALFAAAENRPGFEDCNTIIYGHHMKNGSMFAHLADWADQEYFEEHSEMWLLTPEQNYRVDLFAGYLTSADSDTYTIFAGACPEFDEYLAEVHAASDVQSDVETPGDGHYIMLSTCEYEFQNARYVLYGRLAPI